MGLVLNPGGLGDKNFNDMAYDGLLRAQEELGVEFDYLVWVEPLDVGWTGGVEPPATPLSPQPAREAAWRR